VVLADHPFVVFAFIERLEAEGGAVSFGDFYPAIAGSDPAIAGSVMEYMMLSATYVFGAVRLITVGSLGEKNSSVARPVN